MGRLVNIITRICEITVVILVVLITLDILIGVFFRYILGSALSWSEELARYWMIWMGFVAASLVLREESHLGMTVFRDYSPPMVRNLTLLVGDIAIIIFLAVWCWASWQTLQVIKNDISSGLNIRLFWPFLAMPVCSALMIFHQISLIPHHIKMFKAQEN